MFRWLLSLMFLGVFGLGGLFFLQAKLIYFPEDRRLDSCEPPAPTQYIQIGGEQALLTQTGANNLIIFFHGNAGSACNWRYLAANHLAVLGYDTLVVEYPGYGGDTRAPSKEEIAKALPVFQEWVAAQSYETITIFGYSLGAGVGSMYAAAFGADQIILFAPFDSLYAVAFDQGVMVPRNLLTEDYDNIAALSAIEAPIYILHGSDDRTIPAKHSDDLMRALSEAGRDVEREVLQGVGHTGLFESPEFDVRMGRVLRFVVE
ncbi:MAG: alpha/beta fold hydrolase [Rhodobacteraceae bacterium]|nr:alpha/beta fold hydrolase [Paracoccaceae bacterium]